MVGKVCVSVVALLIFILAWQDVQASAYSQQSHALTPSVTFDPLHVCYVPVPFSVRLPCKNTQKIAEILLVVYMYNLYLYLNVILSNPSQLLVPHGQLIFLSL